jgi:hypothetical protein
MRPLARLLGALLVALASLSAAGAVCAHELDSASLSLTEVAPGRFLVRFQAASSALAEDLSAPAVFPEPCRLHGDYLECGAAGLSGTIELPWLEGTLTRVSVHVEELSGRRVARVVSAGAPSVTVYGASATRGVVPTPVVRDYVELGIEHILLGYDHLSFVVLLTLLVRGLPQLFVTITAFTIAHSVSLSATVLGFARLPSAPVEATIALSIVLVAVECLRPEESLARRAPWLVAFAFGLLHGFGFASALLAIGVPERHVPAALLSFNLGVELGQIVVVSLVAGLGLSVRRLGLSSFVPSRAMVYLFGGMAAFWSIERASALFHG